MSKYLYCSLGDGLGGAEQLLFKSAKNKSDKNNVFICFIGKQTNTLWVKDDFTVIYCKWNIFRLIGLLSQNTFYQVMSSHLMMNAILGFCRNIGLLRTKYLVCRESTSVFLRYEGLKLLKYKIAYRLGYHKIDLLITQSKLMKDILLKKQSYLSERCRVETIPNLFEYPSTEVLPNEDIGYYIVSAGRLIPEKGFDILIESFKGVAEDLPNLKLVILGEGSERNFLECKIEDLGLQEKVFLKGFVQDVYPYFKGAQLCVVSSRIEGFPNVLLQMMSQNNKVVSTLCAGGIDDLKGVVNVEANDISALSEGILKCLNQSTSEDDLCREYFDLELNNRSIENYIKSINTYLNNEK